MNPILGAAGSVGEGSKIGRLCQIETVRPGWHAFHLTLAFLLSRCRHIRDIYLPGGAPQRVWAGRQASRQPAKCSD